jgi:hypothetical protein
MHRLYRHHHFVDLGIFLLDQTLHFLKMMRNILCTGDIQPNAANIGFMTELKHIDFQHDRKTHRLGRDHRILWTVDFNRLRNRNPESG